MPTVNEIRSTFIDYFGRHGHQPVASSPLVPHNDPTLLFTNAGIRETILFPLLKPGPAGD